MFEVETVGHFNLGHAQKPVKKMAERTAWNMSPVFYKTLHCRCHWKYVKSLTTPEAMMGWRDTTADGRVQRRQSFRPV